MNILSQLSQLPGSTNALLYLQSLLIFILAYVLSSTLCGYFRAWTALQFGDDTGESYGFLTFNPLAHIDFFGLLCIIVFHIGFGKTVPINPFNIQGKGRIAKTYAAFLSSTFAHLIIALIGLILVTFVPPTVCALVSTEFSSSYSSLAQTFSLILWVMVYLNALLAAISFIVDMFTATMMIFFYDTFLEMGGWSSIILILLPLMLIYLCAQKLGVAVLYFLCTLVSKLSLLFQNVG